MTGFRPVFNAATGERTEFTPVAEDIDGQLVRFRRRSVHGRVITEHVHPRQLACESRLITPRGASARGTGPALTRRRQRILARRCCRTYACRHRHAANSGPEADVGERPAPVAFGSSALTSHLDPDGEFGGWAFPGTPAAAGPCPAAYRVLYIGAEALDPKGTDQVISTMAAAQFLVTSSNSASSQAFTYLYFLTAYTVPVVMGFALWRSRDRTALAGGPVHRRPEIAEAHSAKGPVVIWFMLPFAVAMVLLAARIWRAAAPARKPRQPTEPANSPAQPGRTA